MDLFFFFFFWWDYITTTKKVKSWAPIGFLFLSLTLSPYISHSLRLMFGKKIFDGIHPPDQPAIPVTKFRVMDYYLKCLRQDVDIYGTKKKNNFV